MTSLTKLIAISALLLNCAINSSAIQCHNCLHTKSQPNLECLEQKDSYPLRNSNAAETLKDEVEGGKQHANNSDGRQTVEACAIFCGKSKGQDSFLRYPTSTESADQVGTCRNLLNTGYKCSCGENYCNNKPAETVPECPFKSVNGPAGSGGGEGGDGSGTEAVYLPKPSVYRISFFAIPTFYLIVHPLRNYA